MILIIFFITNRLNIATYNSQEYYLKMFISLGFFYSHHILVFSTRDINLGPINLSLPPLFIQA